MSVVEKYPEHQKLQAVKDKSQAIGDFIEYLRGKGYVICEKVNSVENEDGELTDYEKEQWIIGWNWMQAHLPIEKTLAEYYEIDLNKLEIEKRVMLDEFRKQTNI